MAGTLPPDSKLLPLLRDMKFASASDGEANIQHGRESMGKKINATVLGTDAIPEEITLSVQVFMTSDITLRMEVRCAVDIYVQEQMFRIVPLPMQLQRAVDGTMDHIMERLSHLKCPVYMGVA